MNTINKLKELLGIKPNDWVTIWYDYGKWRIKNNTDFGNYITNETCHFYIQHSKSRDKYIIKMSGYSPKKHHIYYDAMAKLIELNKSQTNHTP